MIPVTFQEASQALQVFLPRSGSQYAQNRNFDRGPENRENVSQLSAVLRTRILSEKEVIQAVMQTHSWEQAEKFLQEVLWRSYWKSWLELRPSVWQQYVLATQTQKMTPALSLALSGETGIACFDAWRKELKETGYLHNHTRMWFASIWIFTLNLPWELGAQLFENELLDFDAASNTLSWRWVAGLHTPGKHYVARAENIRTFTEGRWDPESQLNETATALPFEASPLVSVTSQWSPLMLPQGPWGLLVHDEDYSIDRTALREGAFSSVALWNPADEENQSDCVRQEKKKMQQDVMKRLEAHFKQPVQIISEAGSGSQIVSWVKAQKLEGVYLMQPWQGRLGDLWRKLEPLLATESISTRLFRRDYDKPFSGKAKAGFFSFKESMKHEIAHLAEAPVGVLEKVWQTN